MGILVHYLSEIPKEYTIYGVYIANPFGTVAEKVIAENFETIADRIGSDKIIAKFLIWEEADKAEVKFGIKTTDLKPVLVITEIHPAEWTPNKPMIKIELGKLKREDDVKNFLLLLTKWLADEDLGKIRWKLRMQRLKDYASQLPVLISLIGAAS